MRRNRREGEEEKPGAGPILPGFLGERVVVLICGQRGSIPVPEPPKKHHEATLPSLPWVPQLWGTCERPVGGLEGGDGGPHTKQNSAAFELPHHMPGPFPQMH